MTIRYVLVGVDVLDQRGVDLRVANHLRARNVEVIGAVDATDEILAYPVAYSALLEGLT